MKIENKLEEVSQEHIQSWPQHSETQVFKRVAVHLIF